MDVLMITADTNALREGSPAQARFKEYALLGRHWVVIVLNSRREHYAARKVGDSLWFIPINAYLRFLAPFQALAVARRQLFFQGRLQVDVIAARDATSSALAAWLIARRFRRPLHIYLSQNVVSDQWGKESVGNWLRMQLARFLVARADALSTDSESVRAALATMSVAIGDRTTLIPRFIDVPSIRSESLRVDLAAKYPHFKFILLVVAPLSRAYNVQLAITVLAGVLRSYAHAGLVIVGEGPLKRRLRAHARHLGVLHRVAFETWNENLDSYYKSAHVLLVTAPYEEYGDTIAEAAAGSCAIVSTPVGLAAAFIKSGESGFLCDPSDPAAFVKAIMLMIKDPPVRERTRLNGMLAVDAYMGHTDGAQRLALAKQSWEAAIESARAR